jgi:hypothetical protein
MKNVTAVSKRVAAMAAVLFCGLTSHSARAAGAGQQGGQPVPPQSRVRYEALATTQDGATGTYRYETRSVVAVGGAKTAYFVAEASGPTALCGTNGFTGSAPSSPSPYQWRLTTRVLGVTANQTRLQVNWTRWKSGSEDGEGSRTVTLGPDDRHVFEFIAAPSAQPAGCSNLMLQVAAAPVPSDEAPSMLAFDVWLLHEDASGQRWSHDRIYSPSAVAREFTLAPLFWTASGRPSDAPEADGVRLAVTGDIRATLDSSGFVDVAVTAKRALHWRGQAGVEGGRQEFRARLGESAAIELPEAKAVVEATGAMAHARGLQIGNGSAAMRFGEFFAGSRTSVVVIVSKAPVGAR